MSFHDDDVARDELPLLGACLLEQRLRDGREKGIAFLDEVERPPFRIEAVQDGDHETAVAILLLTDTQLAADTTDLRVLGVPLKLIAAQDIGGRDHDLFDEILVDDHENAELVSSVLTHALTELPGAQAITDQGTPYMAAATAATLEALDVEHAPQPEGAPTKKATIERAFGTIKTIAAPLLAITNKLAAALPTLAQPSFAKAAAHVILRRTGPQQRPAPLEPLRN